MNKSQVTKYWFRYSLIEIAGTGRVRSNYILFLHTISLFTTNSADLYFEV